MKTVWGLVSILIFSGCASIFPTETSAPKDPALAQDRVACRDQSSISEMGRNSPNAYRAQALYNRCMELRGHPPE